MARPVSVLASVIPAKAGIHDERKGQVDGMGSISARVAGCAMCELGVLFGEVVLLEGEMSDDYREVW